MRTPKARALGKALRKAREERGYGLREFAKVVKRDPGVLSRWETGERIPSPDQVAQYLTRLEVIGDPYEEIMELTRATDEPRWLAISLPEQRQQFEALLDFEQRATMITNLSPLLVPGLLQTSGYIRSIMSAGDVPDRELSRRIALRIGRRDVLTRRDPKPARLAAFVGEGVLRQLIGTREVMAEQLRHLRDAMKWPNVDLRVVPFDSGWHPALEGPCLVIDSDESEPVVHLELRDSVLFLHEEDDVNRYRQAVEKVQSVALDPQGSAEVIAGYIQRWENVE
jgi:transcriptional regulator with XRE-family HTH domain